MLLTDANTSSGTSLEAGQPASCSLVGFHSGACSGHRIRLCDRCARALLKHVVIWKVNAVKVVSTVRDHRLRPAKDSELGSLLPKATRTSFRQCAPQDGAVYAAPRGHRNGRWTSMRTPSLRTSWSLKIRNGSHAEAGPGELKLCSDHRTTASAAQRPREAFMCGAGPSTRDRLVGASEAALCAHETSVGWKGFLIRPCITRQSGSGFSRSALLHRAPNRPWKWLLPLLASGPSQQFQS